MSAVPLEPSPAGSEAGRPSGSRMRQVVVGKAGLIVVTEVPIPTPAPGEVLIRTQYSLISSGTESAVRSQSGSISALGRRAITDARIRSKALDRLRTHGLRATVQEARRRAGSDQELGYSAAGTVAALGSSVTDLAFGQTVAAAGAGYANHAEWIAVPRTLVSPVPEGVPPDHAAFATVGAVALHAFRLSRCELGGVVAIVGLGLVGQLAAQIAAAAGCTVVGTDPLLARCERARQNVPHGIFLTDADLLFAALGDLGHGVGADAVLITASTADPGLANSSLRLARDRGRVVVVGDVRLVLDRGPMYRKELELVVSRSYGPGRYDPEYEEQGVDYPIGHVRWTIGRNLETVLGLIQSGRLRLDSLITARILLEEAARAYELLKQPETHLAVLLEYSPPPVPVHRMERSVIRAIPAVAYDALPASDRLSVVLIGPGSFAMSVLEPALQKTGRVRITSVVARRATHAQAAARRLGADRAETDVVAALSRPDVDAAVIATRHDSHAELARLALENGKHVFLEKPLGLTVEECESAVEASRASRRILMVDFNRRFSPHAVLLKQELTALGSGLTVMYRVDAGYLPPEHWLLDPHVGGGRVVGEAVHFFDFMRWLFDTDPIAVQMDPRAVRDPGNQAVCTLVFPRGSSASLIYTGTGSGRAKERIEAFGAGHTWLLDDFRRTERDGRVLLRGPQRKGHEEAVAHFVGAVLGQFPLAVDAADGARATALALGSQHSALELGEWLSRTAGC